MRLLEHLQAVLALSRPYALELALCRPLLPMMQILALSRPLLRAALLTFVLMRKLLALSRPCELRLAMA